MKCEVTESRSRVFVYARVLFLGLAACWQVVADSQIKWEGHTADQTHDLKHDEAWNIRVYPAPVSICWRRCVHGLHRIAGRSRAPIDGKRTIAEQSKT